MTTRVNTYDIGDVVVLEATFTTTDNDTATNPTAVTLTVRRPDGTLDEIAGVDIDNPAVGGYRHDYELENDYPEGTVWYRWQGTGVAAGAEEGRFEVRQQRVPAS